jgi:putative flippase GtrA
MHLLSDALQFLRENNLRTIIARMNARDTHPFIQFVKYVVCGVGATVVHQGLFYLLSYYVNPAADGMMVDGKPITAAMRYNNSLINNTLAFVPSVMFAYITNVLWVFTPGRHSRVVEFASFFGIAMVAFVVATLAGPKLIDLYSIPTWAAQGLFLVSSVLVNFVCRKFFVFKG